MSTLGKCYRALSIAGQVKAASKGPDALAKNFVRRKAHRTLAHSLRKMLR